MNSISLENRTKIIKNYYENSGTVKFTFRKIRDIFGHNSLPKSAVKNLVIKFELTGSIQNVRIATRVDWVVQHIAAVSHSVNNGEF